MNDKTHTDPNAAGPLSADQLAFLEKLNQSFGNKEAARADWCDIRNSFSAGTQYNGKIGIGSLSAEFTFTLNPDGTVSMVSVKALGKDFTEAVRNQGGDRIPVKNSSRGYDCRRTDYYLAWELYGPAIEFIKQTVRDYTAGTVSPEEPLVYARWYGHDDNQRWFYTRVGILWPHCQLSF